MKAWFSIMYMKSISLKNFRQFASESEAAITVEFNPNFNILVGENDSGKTAIIDSMRYLLGSVSEDYINIQKDDFYRVSENVYSDSFYIEGVFSDLTENEAGSFLEWLSFNDKNEYELRVSLKVEKKKNENGQEYIDRKVQAGEKEFESVLNSKAKEYLKVTYLKPLRDASNELKPGFRSRLAHILKAHPAFKESGSDSEHKLVTTMKEANNKIESYFLEEYKEGRSLVNDLELFLSDFHDAADKSKSRSKFSVTQTDLTSILKRLSLDTEDVNLGLGNLNLLFIATELLLLKEGSSNEIIGPQITLIEEIEAHLHPQAQIRLIKYLENELEEGRSNSQYILTSHSTNLVASVDPRNIIFMNNKIAFPMKETYTRLEENDYSFIERFLDSTKSNLFFAKGIIFVEGDSEILLMPAIANLIGYPLHKNGVSLVNVNGTSFERYVKLFSRSDSWRNTLKRPAIVTPISIITDLDIKPMIYYKTEEKSKYIYSIIDSIELDAVLKLCDATLEDLNCEQLGGEYTTLNKLSLAFGFEVTDNNKEQLESITRKDITEEFIFNSKVQKKINLEQKYSNYDANLEICIAPEWTLEYSLALSSIADLLAQSIHEARYKSPYNNKNQAKLKALIKEIKEKPNNPRVAYEIFKPVNDKLVSKAEVAQILAIKINRIISSPEEYSKRKEIILKDDKLNYLIKAIMHSADLTKMKEDEK